MPIHPTEQALLDKLNERFAPDKKDGKLPEYEQKLLDDLTAEFEKDGITTTQKVREIAKQDMDVAVKDAEKVTSTIGGVEKTAKDIKKVLNKLPFGGRQKRNDVDKTIDAGEKTSDLVDDKKVAHIKEMLNPIKIGELADNAGMPKTDLEAKKMEEAAKTTVKPVTTTTQNTTVPATGNAINDLLVAAAGADKVLDSKELQGVLNDPKFLVAANINKSTDVYVMNRSETAGAASRDSIAIGEGDPINLGSLGIKLADSQEPGKPGNAAGFKSGPSTLKTR